MSIEKPSIPQGTRDFGPTVMARRNYIFDTIRATYKKFGYLPLETPSMEKLSVLTGKYGDEGDQLIFKILNNGEYLSKRGKKIVTPETLEQGEKHLTSLISEKALRYDLTVPFARYVVMHRNDIAFPFKRFQIQPVWRGDKPNKGRYREFYQCDADVVGTESLICEAEMILMMNEVLSSLKIQDFDIKLNNRKILSAIATLLEKEEQATDLFVAIDKLDKIGIDKVCDELSNKGFTDKSLEQLKSILSLSGSTTEKLSTLKSIFEGIEEGLKGIEELEEILSNVALFGLEETNVDFDITLARGLSYYTGAIFEIKVNHVSIGSISGGGRYDNLTGVFGLPDVPGVGFSFGVDRVYDVMEELSLFPEETVISSQVLITTFDDEGIQYALPLLTKLRAAGINSEVYPKATKIKKQLAYANKKNIPFVVVIGSDEVESGKLTFKNMQEGGQSSLTIEEIIDQLK